VLLWDCMFLRPRARLRGSRSLGHSLCELTIPGSSSHAPTNSTGLGQQSSRARPVLVVVDPPVLQENLCLSNRPGGFCSARKCS
jgi:hypothetical protein